MNHKGGVLNMCSLLYTRLEAAAASFSVLCFLMSGTSASSWCQSVTVQEHPNQWHHRSIAPAPAPDSDRERQLWEIRGDMFDRDSGAPYPLENPIAAKAFEDTKSTAGTAEDRYFTTNPMPVKDSNVVVVATFDDFVVRLSPSK